MATSIPPTDIWATANGEESGLPVIYRYRQNRPNALSPDRYPNAVRVIWEYDRLIRNGMPPHETNNQQVAFEDALEPIGDGDTGCLMLVFTGNGRKEWLYYVSDPNAWVNRLNLLLKGHEPYPLQIEDRRDDTWSIWQSFADSVVMPANNSLERSRER